MTPLQRYIAEEIATDHVDGLLSRREALREAQEWFEQENGHFKLDEQGKPIPHWSLHLIPTCTGDAVPVESEQEYLENKQDCGFDSEKWVKMKRVRAHEIAKQYRDTKKTNK